MQQELVMNTYYVPAAVLLTVGTAVNTTDKNPYPGGSCIPGSLGKLSHSVQLLAFESLLCARSYARQWRFSWEQNRPGSCPHGICGLIITQN